MSNYYQNTRHPITKKYESAEWLDDYYGPHRYGVRFKSDGKVYNPEEHDMFVQVSFKRNKGYEKEND